MLWIFCGVSKCSKKASMPRIGLYMELLTFSRSFNYYCHIFYCIEKNLLAKGMISSNAWCIWVDKLDTLLHACNLIHITTGLLLTLFLIYISIERKWSFQIINQVFWNLLSRIILIWIKVKVLESRRKCPTKRKSSVVLFTLIENTLCY